MEKFIFDVDGTILEKDYQYESDYFKSVLGDSDATKLLSVLPKLLSKYERGYFKYDVFDLSEYLREKTGLYITPKILNGWIEAGKDCNNKVFPGVRETLEYLKHNGKQVVALSNWFKDMQVARLNKMQLLEYFDEVYGADQVALKPNYECYEAACGEVPFSQCVMIGDSLNEDVLVPLKFGMDAVYFHPKDDDIETDAKVKVIKSIIDIKEMY